MKFLSRLLLKMAVWLSPGDGVTSPLSTISENPLDLKKLDKLSMLLYSLLSEGPSSMQSLEIFHQIEVQQLEAAKMATVYKQRKMLPHRTYSLSLSHDGVSWIAKADYPGNTSLVGRGDCPATALNDFDEQWLGIK
jgi:hypothetical protein